MHVKNKDDRPDAPKCCDRCNTVLLPEKLKRFYKLIGGIHIVNWHCEYCATASDSSNIIGSVAAMLHIHDKNNWLKLQDLRNALG